MSKQKGTKAMSKQITDAVPASQCWLVKYDDGSLGRVSWGTPEADQAMAMWFNYRDDVPKEAKEAK